MRLRFQLCRADLYSLRFDYSRREHFVKIPVPSDMEEIKFFPVEKKPTDAEPDQVDQFNERAIYAHSISSHLQKRRPTGATSTS